MNHRTPLLWVLAASLVTGGCVATSSKPERRTELRSPDGRIGISVNTRGQLSYSLVVDGQPILLSARLGLVLRDEGSLGKEARFVGAPQRTIDTTWTGIPGGKRRVVRDHANELTLKLREAGGREFDLIFRAYNDGLAFRYVLPKVPGHDMFAVERELTEFAFASDCICYSGQNARLGFEGSQEWEFNPGKLSDIKSGDVVGCPVLVQTPAAWVALTESDLIDWSGLWFTRTPTNLHGGVTLTAQLAPRLDGQGLVKAKLPHRSPWRVVMIGRKAGDLMESDLVVKLASAAKPGKGGWVKPGLMAWDGWWAGDRPMNNGTLEQNIQVAADMGWPYMLIDGGWYGGSNKPDSDLRRVNPAVDLDEVRWFAAQRNVRLWLWVRWNELERFEPADKFFTRC
jgi:alpha-glucosidase